jgi:hypothetical protein
MFVQVKKGIPEKGKHSPEIILAPNGLKPE